MSNPVLDIALAQQRADAIAGTALLVVGFAAQLGPALGWEPSWATTSRCLAAAAILIFVTLMFLVFVSRPWHVRSTLQERFRHVTVDDELFTQPPSMLAMTIYNAAKARGRPMESSELFSDVAVDLIGAKRWKDIESSGTTIAADVTRSLSTSPIRDW